MLDSKPKWITHAEVESEFKTLNLPEGWAKEPEPKKADIFFTKFREWREQVYEEHLGTLRQEERDSLAAGEHPSQSHDRAEEAKVYADKLMSELREGGINFVKDVKLGSYHCDRLIFSLILESGTDENEARERLPFYFRGFEVKWRPEKPMSESGRREI